MGSAPMGGPAPGGPMGGAPMGGPPMMAPPGMTPPGMMPGGPQYPGPGMGGAPGYGGMPQGMGMQPGGMGMHPGMAPGPYGAPQGYMAPGSPHQAPPYLASQTAARMGAPQEPWAESLKTLMLAFGIALVACFVLPWVLAPKVGFSWDVIKMAQGKAKLQPLLIGGTGLLAVVLALLPLTVPVRGIAAAAIGFVPVALMATVLATFHWQSLLLLASALTLVSGLLVRSEYPGSMVPRLMVTMGVACMLVPAFLQDASLIDQVKVIGKVPGKEKVAILVNLVPHALALIGLVLTWLPSPGAMGTHVVAWLFIIWPIAESLIDLGLAGSGAGALIKSDMFHVFWLPITLMAWNALTGYGTASAVGKSLELT